MEKPARKIEWNPDHKTPQEQELESMVKFSLMSPQEKFDILIKLCNTRINKGDTKSTKRIEWI